MSPRILPRVVVPALLATLGVHAPAAAQSFRLGGGEAAVYNLAGRVEIVQGSGSETVVTVTRSGADADRLELDVLDVGERRALVVRYPTDRVVYTRLGRGSRGQYHVRSDGTFGDGGRGGERVTITGSGSGLEAWADLRVEVPAGRAVAVWVAVGEADVRGVRGDVRVDLGSGSVDASSVTGSLFVDTGSGSVSVRDVDGDLTVDTGSGSVEVDGVRGDRILVDTGSGRVRGTDLVAASVRVDTGSGSIDLARVGSPDVYLDTGSGSIEVELTRDVESLDIDTGSGSVTVRFPEDVGATLEVETGSGVIDVEFPVELRTMRRDHIVGSVGDGRGRIRIDTGSGGVRLLRANRPL